MSDPVDRDRLAADWIGYALAWGRRQRPRHWDWEQAAIDGLTRAVQAFDPARSPAFVSLLRWHLRGAAADLRRYRDRPRRAGTVRLAEGSDDDIPALGEPVGAALERSDECAAVLARLPASDRLTLCGIADGLSIPQIARTLPVAPPTLRSRLRTIRSRHLEGSSRGAH